MRHFYHDCHSHENGNPLDTRLRGYDEQSLRGYDDIL